MEMIAQPFLILWRGSDISPPAAFPLAIVILFSFSHAAAWFPLLGLISRLPTLIPNPPPHQQPSFSPPHSQLLGPVLPHFHRLPAFLVQILATAVSSLTSEL